MSSYSFILPYVPVFGLTGAILPGAKAWFTQPENDTPITIYSDAELETPTSNPAIADASGKFAPLYLNSQVPVRVRIYMPTATPGVDTPLQDYDPFVPGASGTAGLISITDFGAVGDGVTDDTAAIQAAIDSLPLGPSNFTSLFIPPGDYRVTDQINIDRDYVSLIGTGDASCFYFDPPVTGRTMLYVRNADNAEVIKGIVLHDFSFRAAYPASGIVKTGIRLIDASQVSMRNVRIPDYSWTDKTGTGSGSSIGIHMSGRDTHNIIDCYFVADKPMYVTTNPNTSVWQFDYHNFIGIIFQTFDPVGYGITFGAGVNPTSWTMIGCAAVSGNGGIFLDNEGHVVTGTPSLIRIENFRCEGGVANGVGSGGGYGIYMDFGTGNPACSSLVIEDSSVNDPTCYGYFLKGISALKVRNVNCGFAASNNAFILEDVGIASIDALGIGHASAVVTFDNMYAQEVYKTPGGTSSSKSIAKAQYLHYTSDTPANNLMYRNGVRKWQRTQVLANGESIALPALVAGKSMQIQVVSSYGGALYIAVPTVTALVAGTTGFGITGGDVISCQTDGAGNTIIKNNSAGTMEFFVETTGG